MLALIGLGVNGIDSISLAGDATLRQSDIVYLDSYTTPIPQNLVNRLCEQVGKQVIVLDQARLEEGIERIMNEAKTNLVSLVVLGDPLFATTHINFLIEAKKRNLPCKVIHNTSIASILASSCGLHPYRFGRVTTIVREHGTPATSTYFTLYDNLMKGVHTLFLLEFDIKTNVGVSPLTAFNVLKDAEEVYELGAFSDSTFVIVACRVGREDERFFVQKVSGLWETDFGDPPYSIIVPSKLHFTEEEAICALYGVDQSIIADNTQNLRRRTDVLVKKYVKKTQEILHEARKKLTREKLKELDDLFENVECYLNDSLRFLNLGEDELAMLSVGYAEGLLDSLRLQRIIDLKW
ncbi:MAG: diphthine synthase [Nitrososphaeria archaeon]